MRIAVSGAGGLIGSRLVGQLETSGHEVVRMIRTAGEFSPACSNHSIAWNPNRGLVDPDEWNHIDAVYHLAGRSIGAARWTKAERRRIRDSRLLTTEALVNQILEAKNPPELFVGASAIGIYGDCGPRIVDEESAAGESFLAQLASQWEEKCQPLLHAGVRVVNPRFGMVCSKSGGALAKVLPVFRWCAGGKLGRGDQYWSWIALEDCVAALEWMLPAGRSGPYNLVAPVAVTNTEFTRALSKALGRPAWLPAPKLLLRAAMGELANELLLTSCRCLPAKLLEDGFEFRYSDLSTFLVQELSGDASETLSS